MKEKLIILLCGRKRSGKETSFKIMYPYLDTPEEFQFATPLKKFCMENLGLTWEQCYGSSEHRESLTKYSWKDIAPAICQKYDKNPDDCLTAREVLQVIGTDLMRDQFYREIWAEAGIRLGLASKAISCVYSDVRFPNEIEASYRSKVRTIPIRLYRDTGLEDSHDSEKSLDEFDLIPNQRRVSSLDRAALEQRGFVPDSVPNLWVRVSGSNLFKYLVDNNSDFTSLQNCMQKILKLENLLKEPNLS